MVLLCSSLNLNVHLISVKGARRKQMRRASAELFSSQYYTPIVNISDQNHKSAEVEDGIE